MNKYEQLIEHIINENEKAASELFHQIVVEKSRDIYESLMDEEEDEQMDENFGGNPAADFVQDVQDEQQQGLEQGIGEDDEEGEEFELGGDDEEFGDEETFGGEEEHGEHGEIIGKIDDLEAQLADLKAMLAGEEAGEEHEMGDMDHDMGDEESMGDEEHSDFDADMMEAEEDDEEDDEEDLEESKKTDKKPVNKKDDKKAKKSDVEIMKEYVDKIGEIYKQEPASGEGKTVGTGGDAPTVNKKSISLEKGPDFGGTSGNIVKGGANENPDGKQYKGPNNAYSKGQGQIEVTQRQVNQPGGKGADKFFNHKETAYEKNRGKEGQTTDGSVPVAKKSVQVQNTGKK